MSQSPDEQSGPRVRQPFPVRLLTSLRRAGRKHAAPLLAIATFNVVIFFPVLFMGRVVSPNDVFFNGEPWSLYKTVDVQNSLINDPPTAYYTLMSLVKDDWSAFHWNRYVASGIPGFGSSAAAVLSPFIFLPVILLPLVWSYTAILFLKINVMFLFAWLWLREERLGKLGAAVGATVIAGSGIYSVRWLWQVTNATVLIPALLWALVRLMHGKRNSVFLLTLLVVAYALSGFPAAMAYGAWLAGAYFVYLCARERRVPMRGTVEGAAAVVIGLFVASPSLVPFIQFLKRTGYLETRGEASLANFYPLTHWRSFLWPERLGNIAYKNWLGDPALGTMNNYVEATIYIGVVVLPLLLPGIADRRARSRWFWLVVALVITAAMFGIGGPFLRALGSLPGFKYSPMPRARLLLPIAVGFLGASGVRLLVRWIGPRVTGRRRSLARLAAILIGIAAAADLGVFSARSLPYLPSGAASVPDTPVIRFLHEQKGDFRIAPFFNFLWPNSAELFRFEDIRSHFGSESRYRQLLQRIDPTCWSNGSTVLQFNSLKFNFDDPLLSMLGVRYLIEHKDIDIVRWHVYKQTVPGVAEDGVLTMLPGATLQRSVRIADDPFYAMEISVHVESVLRRTARLTMTLLDSGGQKVYERSYAAADLAAMPKVYVPVRPYARLGDSLFIRIKAEGLILTLQKSIPTAPGESPIFFGRVKTPIVLDRELPDARIFRNLAEVPRFHAVWRLRHATRDAFVTLRNVDFQDEAVITDGGSSLSALGNVAPPDRHVRLSVGPFQSERLITTTAAVPFFLATSEKLTPELRILLDGTEVEAVEINAMFAGVAVPAGKHQVIFARRIGRGAWPFSLAGLLLAGASAVYDRRRRLAWPA